MANFVFIGSHATVKPVFCFTFVNKSLAIPRIIADLEWVEVSIIEQTHLVFVFRRPVFTDWVELTQS